MRRKQLPFMVKNMSNLIQYGVGYVFGLIKLKADIMPHTLKYIFKPELVFISLN